jgi:hypothetical protein
MPDLLDEWKDAKREFERSTGKKKPTEEMKVLGARVRKSSGFEKPLGDFDKAFREGRRNAAAQAYQKFVLASDQWFFVVNKAKAQEPDDDMLPHYDELVRVMVEIQRRMPKLLEKLQTDKGGPDIGVQPFLADLQSQIKAFEKKTKQSPAAVAAEKAAKIAKNAAAGVQLLGEYTKTAARTQLREALNALVAFEDWADMHAARCLQVADKVEGTEALADYERECREFAGFLRNLCGGRLATAKRQITEAIGD